MTAPREPILDIDTLIVRPAITIDGTRFELLAPGELSIRQSHSFGICARRMQALQDSDIEADADEVDQIVDQIVQLVVVDLPERVFAALSDEHKLSIAQLFTGLLLRNRMTVAEATAQAMTDHPGIRSSRQTGGRSSPGSSGSSAGRRWTGWITRLWRW